MPALFAVLNIPVRARGTSQTSVALMMEDSGAAKNFIMNALGRKDLLGTSLYTSSRRMAAFIWPAVSTY